MDAAALKAIQEQGFTVLPALFSTEFLDQVLAAIGRAPLNRSRAGVRHALRLDPVGKIARCPQLLGIATGVLGPGALPFRATLFEKTLSANWLVVWHQDTALPLRQRQELQGWGPWSVKDGVIYAHAPASPLCQVLALRVHFDDSMLSNGPLRVLPGTHHVGVLSDDQIQELAETSRPVDCAVTKGGVVAMHPLCVHASSKSRSEIPRRALHIEYAASERIASPLRLAFA